MIDPTLSGYDEIPYESLPIAETHPDRLAVIGGLFGLKTPNPAGARILELGCASGGNLIPMAWYLPGTRCVGVELSRNQAARGAALVDALDLANIRIEHRDILDVPIDGEPYDYIIAHGVFSWVPDAVREHILAVCGSRLSAGGVAYISYNTLPGGRQRAMLRDMLLHHVRGQHSPRGRLAAARELLEFLQTPLPSAPPGRDWLESELKYLARARDSYLYHEYLEEQNEAVLFSDFVSAATRHRLQYLADSQLHTMFPSTLGTAAERALEGFGDLVSEEQYADFLCLRAFRQSLLCRADAPLQREVDLDALLGLPLYTDLVADRSPGRFRNASGRGFRVDHPLAQAVLRVLASSFPRARMLTEVLPEAVRTLPPRSVRKGRFDAGLRTELFNLFVSGALHLTRVAPDGPPTDPAPGGKKRASGLARAFVAQGEQRIPTARHQALELDPLGARMVALLDGSREHDEIVSALASGSAHGSESGDPAGTGSPECSHAALSANLERLSALLTRHGLLETG